MSTISDWQAESLRVTAFPGPSAQVNDLNWWIEVIGEPPETRISKPRLGEYREEGYLEPGRLVLHLQPGRIDWHFIALQSEEQVGEKVEPLGPFQEILDVFLQPIARWFTLDTFIPVQRLAFGAVLLQPVKDKHAGYTKLSPYLPSVKIDSVNSSDFLYQINRRRNSRTTMPDLSINRLSKWSLRRFHSSFLKIGPTQPGIIKTGSQSYDCRLELDINTNPDFEGEFDKQKVQEVFDELVALGIEIAREGDIP